MGSYPSKERAVDATLKMEMQHLIKNVVEEQLHNSFGAKSTNEDE